MLSVRRVLLSSTVAVAASTVVLGVATATALAGTASLQGTTASFADPAGADDHLQVTFEQDEASAWRANFFTAREPMVTAGAGCAEGFVGVDCVTGATPPGAAIDLGAGDDELDAIARTFIAGQRIAIVGGAGNDIVTKHQVGATIDLGAGNDEVHPDSRGDLPPEATPGDVIRGGAGTDTVDYSDAIDPIAVSLDGVANDGREGEGDNVMPDVENVVGSEFGGTIIGSARANVLRGPAAERRIVGGGGRDRLIGSGVLDALDGAGGDRVECLGNTDVAQADGGDIVAKDCAKVVWAPAVSSSRLRYRAKRVRVKLACPKASSGACRGTLRLRTAKGKKLAAKGYRTKRGRTATVSLRVKRKPSRKATLIVAPKGTSPIAGRAVTIR